MSLNGGGWAYCDESVVNTLLTSHLELNSMYTQLYLLQV